MRTAKRTSDPRILYLFQAKKSSEDWELFNKLLGKVETTVQSTVQTIEKVKESSVVEEINQKEKASQIVIPEYKGVKSFEEAKREKEEREREALKQRRDASGENIFRSLGRSLICCGVSGRLFPSPICGPLN